MIAFIFRHLLKILHWYGRQYGKFYRRKKDRLSNSTTLEADQSSLGNIWLIYTGMEGFNGELALVSSPSEQRISSYGRQVVDSRYISYR